MDVGKSVVVVVDVLLREPRRCGYLNVHGCRESGGTEAARGEGGSETTVGDRPLAGGTGYGPVTPVAMAPCGESTMPGT